MEARIKLTKRMLTKSIMDANKSVQALADEIDYSYNQIANGDKVTIDALYEDDTRQRYVYTVGHEVTGYCPSRTYVSSQARETHLAYVQRLLSQMT